MCTHLYTGFHRGASVMPCAAAVQAQILQLRRRLRLFQGSLSERLGSVFRKTPCRFAPSRTKRPSKVTELTVSIVVRLCSRLFPRVSPLLSAQVRSQPGRDSSINPCSVYRRKVSRHSLKDTGKKEKGSTRQAAQHFRGAWQVISEKRKEGTIQTEHVLHRIRQIKTQR